MIRAYKPLLAALLLALLLLCACGAKTAANPDDAASSASGAPAQNAAAAPARPEETEKAEQSKEPQEPEETEETEALAFLPPESDADYDLVLFFAAADTGDYEFSIAPEGSDDWQQLDEAHWLGTCGRSDEHLRVHQQPSHISKFGFRFDGETNGRYQLRTTTIGVTPAEVQCRWSLVIGDQTTLLVVSYDAETSGLLSALSPMRRCADCPQSWFQQAEAAAIEQPTTVDSCYLALPQDDTASYFLCPENTLSWTAIDAGTSDGLCENAQAHGDGYRLLRVPLDAAAAGACYQLRRVEDGVVTATWHDISIPDGATLLRVYKQPEAAQWQSAWCAEEDLLLLERYMRCASCPASWQEAACQAFGSIALCAGAAASADHTADGYLEFYFGADNVGWYEFSIAPEGSDEWVYLEDVQLDDGWSEEGRSRPPRYGVGFAAETSGLYQLRATVKAPLPFAISNIWHNLPVQPEGTLLYVACPPGVEQWHEKLPAQEAVIVKQMESGALVLTPD